MDARHDTLCGASRFVLMVEKFTDTADVAHGVRALTESLIALDRLDPKLLGK